VLRAIEGPTELKLRPMVLFPVRRRTADGGPRKKALFGSPEQKVIPCVRPWFAVIEAIHLYPATWVTHKSLRGGRLHVHRGGSPNGPNPFADEPHGDSGEGPNQFPHAGRQ
jgi:hypothetical protein